MNPSAPLRRWQPGDHILVREILHGQVWSAKPVTVVQDTLDLIAYYMAEGTTLKRPFTPQHSRPTPRERLQGAASVTADAKWLGNRTLYLVPPGAKYAVLLWWSVGDGTFAGWYVNLQTPLVRTAMGFD